MANINGKKARKTGGTRFACKRRGTGVVASKKGGRKKFGSLKYSVLAGNVTQFHSGKVEEAEVASLPERF